MRVGNKEDAAVALNNIVSLRDKFLDLDLWSSYSAAMNLLGCEGLHAPDWTTPASAEVVELVKAEMKRIGEL